MRLIDADALKETIDREIFRHETIDHVFQIIDDAPTIEPKRGKWIEPTDDESITITGRCSNCGWESHLLEDDVVGMPFCPNCGADMRPKGDDDV